MARAIPLSSIYSSQRKKAARRAPYYRVSSRLSEMPGASVRYSSRSIRQDPDCRSWRVWRLGGKPGELLSADEYKGYTDSDVVKRLYINGVIRQEMLLPSTITCCPGPLVLQYFDNGELPVKRLAAENVGSNMVRCNTSVQAKQ